MRFPLAQRQPRSYFFNQFTFYGVRHEGQDYTARTGTPFYAPEDGLFKRVWGKQIGKGGYLYSGNHYYKFAHFNSWEGDSRPVREGDILGYTGNTGLSTNEHLHLAIYLNNKKVDPEKWNWGKEYMTESEFKEYKENSRYKLIDKINEHYCDNQLNEGDKRFLREGSGNDPYYFADILVRFRNDQQFNKRYKKI